MRPLQAAAKRAFTPGFNALVLARSKRSSILLATLLTFCPPGPDDRTAVTLSSSPGMTMWSVTMRSEDMPTMYLAARTRKN